MNVYSFGIDEDSRVFDESFSSLELYFKERGKYFCGIFISEWDCSVDESVKEEDFVECFDYDGGVEESVKFKEVVEKYNKIVGVDGYILVSFGVEYDNSWLLLSNEDWEELKKISKEVVEKEEEEGY